MAFARMIAMAFAKTIVMAMAFAMVIASTITIGTGKNGESDNVRVP
jgi:hypothetical protein